MLSGMPLQPSTNNPTMREMVFLRMIHERLQAATVTNRSRNQGENMPRKKKTEPVVEEPVVEEPVVEDERLGGGSAIIAFNVLGQPSVLHCCNGFRRLRELSPGQLLALLPGGGKDKNGLHSVTGTATIKNGRIELLGTAFMKALNARELVLLNQGIHPIQNEEKKGR